MTKSEVYKSIVDITKKTGQGMSGILRVKGGDNVNRYLDQLINDGYVKACKTGGSIGHPESNIFYMPTKGYNVWEDDGDDGEDLRNKGKGRYLRFVRLYLGILPETEHHDENLKWLNPTASMFIRNAEQMKEYAKWLDINQDALKEMLELEPILFDDEKLNTDAIEFIKNRSWYKENKSIDECTTDIIKCNNISKQIINLTKQYINLCEEKGDTTSNGYKEKKSNLQTEEKEIELRNDILAIIRTSTDNDLKIQEFFKDKI